MSVIATAQTTGPQCTFVEGELTRCVQVTMTMPTVPTVGNTAALGIDVAAQVDIDNAEIAADLPAMLKWANAPTGFSPAKPVAGPPEFGGTVSRATHTVTLHKGQTLHLDATVTAVAAGAGPVQVRVAGPARSQVDTASGNLFVTIGAAAGTSHSGYQPAEFNGTSPTPAGTVVSRATPRLGHKSVGKVGLAQPTPLPPGVHPDALTCVHGAWQYQDQNNVFHPSANFQVQLWARLPIIGNVMLSADITDANGDYRLCSGVSGVDVWVRFFAENGKWSVANNNGPYAFVSQTISSIGNGATVDLGALHPTDGNLMRALHAFDEANDAKNWIPGDCWSARHKDCRVVRFLWTPTSTDGSFYQPNENTVHLRADDPNFRSIVVHELGHAVMDEVYNDNFPAAPNCSPHFIQRASSTGCAWTEGFADWYQAAVYNDPQYVGGPNFVVPLETPTWGTPGWDNAPEAFWDNYGEGAPGHL
jgi:hypothetical protein